MSNIVFLPDMRVQNEDTHFFYQDLVLQLNATILNMPDVHEYNTKRFEVQGMSYMRNLLNSTTNDVIIAHGSSADALLRYIESDKVELAIVIDGSQIYTAGERHGRDYRWELIKQNVKKVVLIGITPEGKEDANVLSQKFGHPSILKCMDDDASSIEIISAMSDILQNFKTTL